jgi:DnaJ domain/WD domain, G-beta repeat
MSFLQHHYKTLGLKPGASLDDIKQAYRILAKQCHPDCFLNDPALQQEAEARFKQISEAYEVLKNEIPNPDALMGRARSARSKTTRKPTNPEDFYESGAAHVSQDHTIKIWHIASGSLLKTLEAHTGGVMAIALSPDRQIVVSGSLDGSVRSWQVEGTTIA